MQTSTLDQVAHFRILGRIGAGGMGEVYRARDEKLERDVAIKIVSADKFEDATARARLVREARSAAGLNHPNICVVHEVGETGGQAYIAMECIAGESLSARIARAPLSIAEVIRFGIQLSDALAHAHDKGIVHRDLKPQNVILTPEQRLKVLDFGLAKRMFETVSADGSDSTESVITAQGVIQGTPAYMAPEQLRGLPATERSDIWSLGVILHEMVSRKRPFRGSTWPELSAAILSSPPGPLPAETPHELASIINRCLEKEPDNRYRSAVEVRSALEIIQSTVGSSSRALPVAKRQRRWPLVFAAVFVIAAAITVGFNLKLNYDRSRAWAAPTRDETTTSAALPAAKPRVAVAILPFSSLSGPDEEYLADGIQDAIIGELARLKELRVLSRTSTRSFRATQKSASEIARQLNAENLVEGSVVRSGERIRVQVKLIRTVPTEQQVWSASFERELRDVLSLYGEIGSAVAPQIDSSLALAAKTALAKPEKPVNPEIYTLYLRGMYQLHKGGDEGFKAGLALMNQAIALDPADPLPYTGLAQAYELRIHDGLATPEDIELAKAAAQKAAATAVALPELYGAKAMIAQYSDWDWPAAKENFERALDLNSSLAEFRRHYGWYLVAHNRREEGLMQIRRGKETEPLDGTFYADIGWVLSSLGRPSEGISDARKAIALAPENPYVLENAGFTLAQNKLYDESLRALKKAVELDPNAKWLVAQTLVAAGQPAKAQPIIDELLKSKTADSAYGLAQIYSALGKKDEALSWAQVAIDKRAIYAPWMGVDAGLEAIRHDPRFRKMMEPVGAAVCD